MNIILKLFLFYYTLKLVVKKEHFLKYDKRRRFSAFFLHSENNRVLIP